MYVLGEKYKEKGKKSRGEDESKFIILLFLGITPSSGKGFDDVNPEDVMTLVQLSLEKCLEKEALCNEFYLQMIKQTTEQPGKDIYT